MSVATMVEALAKRLTTRQKEQSRTAWQHYKGLVVDAHAEKPVDLDELEMALDANGRTAEQFAQDVQKYAGRLAQAATFARIPDVQATIKKTEAHRDKVAAELNAAIDRLRPQVQTANEQLRDLEHQILASEAAKGRLLETVMDPTIVEREQELAARRVEIMGRRRIGETQRGEIQGRISWQVANIEGLQSQIAHSKKSVHATGVLDHHQIAERQSKIKESETELRGLRATLGTIETKLQDIDAELQAIQPELDQLQAEKLVP